MILLVKTKSAKWYLYKADYKQDKRFGCANNPTYMIC